jgi:Holliday junction resolvase-like predicted endonuclease
MFLAERRAFERPVRFDVIAVEFRGDGRRRPEIRHYPGAFDATGR